MKHDGTTRIRAGALQHAALLVALLSLSGQVLGIAHLLLVRHVVCPEHGELIDAGPASAKASAKASADNAASAAHARSAAGATSVRGAQHAESAALDDHDHCPVSALRHAQPSLRQATEALAHAGIPAPTAQVVRTLAAPSPVSILLFAPKSSPPASRA